MDYKRLNNKLDVNWNLLLGGNDVKTQRIITKHDLGEATGNCIPQNASIQQRNNYKAYEKGLVGEIRVKLKKFWRYASSKSKTKAVIPKLYNNDPSLSLTRLHSRQYYK